MTLESFADLDEGSDRRAVHVGNTTEVDVHVIDVLGVGVRLQMLVERNGQRRGYLPGKIQNELPVALYVVDIALAGVFHTLFKVRVRHSRINDALEELPQRLIGHGRGDGDRIPRQWMGEAYASRVEVNAATPVRPGKAVLEVPLYVAADPV